MTETNRIEFKRQFTDAFLRNKELMRVFRDVEMVEALGSGMPVILRKYGRESYSFLQHFIRVTIPILNSDDPKNVTKNEPKNVTKNVTKNEPKNELLVAENKCISKRVKKEGLKHMNVTKNEPKNVTKNDPKKLTDDPKNDTNDTKSDPKKVADDTKNDPKNVTKNDPKKLTDDPKNDTNDTKSDPKKVADDTKNDPKKVTHDTKNASDDTKNDPKKVAHDTKNSSNDTKNISNDTKNDYLEILFARRKAIVEMIEKDNKITISAIAKQIGVKPLTIKRYLAEMRHIVQHVGPRNGGHWEFL